MTAKEHLAYLQGWHAAMAGKTAAANRNEADERAAWSHGFEDARERRESGRLTSQLYARIRATAR